MYQHVAAAPMGSQPYVSQHAVGGHQIYVNQGTGQTIQYAGGYPTQGSFVIPQPQTVVQQPMTPKMASMPAHMESSQRHPVATMGPVPVQLGGARAIYQTREQALEIRVRELEQLMAQKDALIKELQKKGYKPSSPKGGMDGGPRSPGRSGGGGACFRKLEGSKPMSRYNAVDQDDAIDLRLEDFYNSTGSAIPFRRINRGFYRFGDTITELDIVNHKLMARTEDGWNRGKFGPIDKFIMYFENIEREKAGIMPEG